LFSGRDFADEREAAVSSEEARRPLRIGFMVSIWQPRSEMTASWQWIVASGADALWVGDHLWSASGSAGLEHPRFDAWSVLGAIAGATNGIRIGSLVTSTAYRSPAVLAKAAITVDHLSDGRFELGIGAGANPRDAAAAGRSPGSVPEREARFAESAEAIDALLHSNLVAYQGRTLRFADVPVAPGSLQPRIPLLIAAGVRSSLEIAGRLADGWISFGGRGSLGSARPETAHATDGPALVRERLARVSDAALAAGRDPAMIRRLYLLVGSEEPNWADVDGLVELLARYRAVGIDEIAMPYPLDPVARGRAAEALPRVRALLAGG
jgi:alkanesulfonate monooxygenase SsuD/methylene tetrahydromethanopterin reductase-like flavin-dependent oxidoreductase (luciferase family)